MKSLKLLLIAVLTVIFVQESFSQQRINGKVVDVIDGKTVVIELETNKKINAELEYIEIPEPEQQLSQAVKDHLQKLLLGKNVEFIAKMVLKTRLIGKVYLGEVDISQQLLRDGAAWYAIAEKDRQDSFERENYQIVESQAKLEKRGVWGIENMKPAWEFRAEKEEQKRQKERLTQANYEKSLKEAEEAKKKPVKKELPKRYPNWIYSESKKYESTNNISGLMIGYSSQDKMGFVTTPQFKIEIVDKENSQKVDIGVTYFYKETEKKGKESYYLVGIESEANEWKFLKTNELIAFADNQRIIIGKATRTFQQEKNSFKETLTYKINRKLVERIANAQKVEFKIGNYAGKLDGDLQNLIKTLLNAAQ